MEMLAKQQVAVVLVLPMMRLKMSRRKKMPRRNRNGIPMWQWKGKKATGVDGWIGVASCWPDWTAVKGTKWKNSRNSNWEAINNIFCFFGVSGISFFVINPSIPLRYNAHPAMAKLLVIINDELDKNHGTDWKRTYHDAKWWKWNWKR